MKESPMSGQHVVLGKSLDGAFLLAGLSKLGILLGRNPSVSYIIPSA